MSCAKNSWTSRDTIWGLGPRNHVLGPDSPGEGAILVASPDPFWSIGNIWHEPKLFCRWQQRRGLSLLVLQCSQFMPSVLWHCWLGIRKSMRPVKIDWWGVGVVICLERGADGLHMVQLMPLHPKIPSSLALFTSRLVLPLWYQVVLEKRPLNGCSAVAVVLQLVVTSGACMAEGDHCRQPGELDHMSSDS